MKRKRKENRTPVTLNMNKRFLEALRRQSRKTRVPMSRLVEDATVKQIPEIRDAMRNV